MKILFTSASTPAALALARVLAAEGHTVHGADEERYWGTAPARYSRAYRRFHRLSECWSASELWKAIGDHIDLVIPFGPLPGHIIESLKSRGARIVGEVLAHNDYEFQDFVRDNIIDATSDSPSIVKVPTSFTVHSRTCVAEILSNWESTFSLQPFPCYDTDDEDTLVDVGLSASTSSLEPATPLVLSCSTLDDGTVEAIKRLPMSDTKPYRLIEVAEGGSFYSAHAFVHTGQIRTFVVTNAQATEREFVITGTEEPIYDVLYQFTVQLAEALESWQTVARNHLNLTFHVLDKVTYGELVRKVSVINCHNDPHPSLVLLASVPELRRALALAYTSPVPADDGWKPVQFPPGAKIPKAVYSAPLAVSEFANILMIARPWRRDWWVCLAHMIMICWVWAVNFKEEMWDPNDPGPVMCFGVVMLLSSIVKTVGRVKGVSWMMQQIASPRSNWKISRAAIVGYTTVFGIARSWLALLLYPWAGLVRSTLRRSDQGRLTSSKS